MGDAALRALAAVAAVSVGLCAAARRPLWVAAPPPALAQGTATPPSPATPPPDADRAALADLAADPAVGWASPELDTLTESDGTVRTTVGQAGDGTFELARISRYPTELAARNAFGDRRPVYLGMPARRGEVSEHTGAAFRDTAFIEFRHGALIFRVETRYERSACGFAREPDGIAAVLAREAVAHGLIPPWPEPTAACDTKVSVEALPCVVAGEAVEVRGRTSIPDCDVIVDGGERRAQAPPSDGEFRVVVPLEPGSAHRLYVGHLLCRIECDGGTFRDEGGTPLRVWRVDGIAIPGTVYLPWADRRTDR